jgi:hypothetical protein
MAMPTTFNQTNEPTYALHFNTLDCRPKMKGVFEEVPANRIQTALSVARNAFREVEVIDEGTGELMYRHTFSPAWFKPQYSYGEAIDIIHETCYGD